MPITYEKIRRPAITCVPGLRASGVHCGIKPDPASPDLAVIVSESPATAAAVFTVNKFRSAHILYDEEILSRHAHEIRGLAINSGCANACTGELGLQNAARVAETLAREAGLPTHSVLVMSTGVIGVQLPMDKILSGIMDAVAQLSYDGGHDAERAIMTTDTKPKEAGIRVHLSNGRTLTIAGMAKGAGMIHPNMATLLAVMAINARIAPPLLQRMVKKAAEASFNRISVDGDTSTNDTLLLLANGGPEAQEITSEEPETLAGIQRGLNLVARHLAQKIVMDGEGASKFISIKVLGARTDAEATCAAKAIANSCLVKTAFFGEDPNWGRILTAVGYSGIETDPAKTDLFFTGSGGAHFQLVSDGTPLDYDEGKAHELLTARRVGVTVDLHLGRGKSVVWTSDLSYDYVKINAHYRT
jgi:glutamate N-acetyltransferase / amino-acid N-acetyltransferase